MNSRLPSRLHHRLALIVLGRGDGEGGRESPPVEPEPSPCRDFEPTDSAEKPFLFCSSAQSYSSLPGGWTNRPRQDRYDG
jgi:hypothetical protein